MMMQVLRVESQALSLIMGVEICPRHRRGMIPETRSKDFKRLRGWVWLLLTAERLATSISVKTLRFGRGGHLYTKIESER
jgi:hypothetical protein